MTLLVRSCRTWPRTPTRLGLEAKSLGSNGGRHVTQVIQTILNLIHGFGEIMMMTTWKLDDFLRLHLWAFPKRDTIAGEF